MKAAIYRFPGRPHEPFLDAVASGLLRHGAIVERFHTSPPIKVDFYVVWGWRLADRVRSEVGSNVNVLVVERGYIGDRFEWTSLGWNGLNGRAIFPTVGEADRFNENFGHLLKPWRDRDHDQRRALVIGQMMGDQSIAKIDIGSWYVDVTNRLLDQQWSVTFRPHPQSVKRNIPCPAPIGARWSAKRTLAEDLEDADLVVTMNSNSGVEAILAGVPVHAEDEGSMVYSLSSHDLTQVRPDRIQRLSEIAWSQWLPKEISSGMAIEHVMAVAPFK